LKAITEKALKTLFNSLYELNLTKIGNFSQKTLITLPTEATPAVSAVALPHSRRMFS
jgi:hypothetical protein